MKKKTAKDVLISESSRRLIYKLTQKDGTEVFLKILCGKNPTAKISMEREAVALEVLRGLAVPKRIVIPKSRVARLIKQKYFNYVAMEWTPHKGCFGREFPTPQALGLWAFTLEQFCAFHRKGVLYTDMKHNHLCVPDDLSEARFVDFGDCIMVESEGLYPTECLASTPQLAAPEFYFSDSHTEKIFVYQLGMLLGSFLLKYFHNNHIHSESMKNVKSKLEKAHAHEVFRLFERCISKNPLERPENLENLFRQVQGHLPLEALQCWSKLRAPYKKELRKLGFTDPLSIEVSEKAA